MRPAVYYPILRAKQGEFEGFWHLSPPVQARVRPLFDIPKPKFSVDSELLDCDLFRVVEAVKWACHANRAVYIDLSRYDLDKKTRSGRLPLELVFLAARQPLLPAIPVAGPGRIRGFDVGNLPTVSRIASERNCGAAFRIPVRDYVNPRELSAAVESVGSELDVPLNQVDLLLDLEGLERMPGHLASKEKLVKYLMEDRKRHVNNALFS